MTTYSYTASGTVQRSANLATDKIRIATTTAVRYVTGSPKVLGTGTIDVATTSNAVVGTTTAFLTEVSVGQWLCGNTTNAAIGQVLSIADDGNLVLTANSSITGATEAFSIAPTSSGFALADANSAIIPANSTWNSIIVGQGNVVSFLNATGSNTAFTITELGMPHAITGTE